MKQRMGEEKIIDGLGPNSRTVLQAQVHSGAAFDHVLLEVELDQYMPCCRIILTSR